MKICKSCGREFQESFSFRVACSDECKKANKKAGIAERNKRGNAKPKKDNLTEVEQAEARFKNKFLVSGWCG